MDQIKIGDIISRPQRRNAKCHCAQVVGETETDYQVRFYNKGGRHFTGEMRPAGFTNSVVRTIKKSEAVKHSQEAFDSYPDE